MRIKYLIIFTLFLATPSNHVFAQSANAESHTPDDSVWVPSQVDWQVVRAKGANTQKDTCLVRWIYDKSVALSFYEKDGRHHFLLNFSKFENPPPLNKKESYYGIFTKKDDSIHQLNINVLNDKTLELMDSSSTGLSSYRPAEKISIFFEDRIYNFPMANALENFEAYEKCLNTISIPQEKLIETSKERAEEKKNAEEALLGRLDDTTAEMIAKHPSRGALPPPLPAFRKSNTKAEIMEKYNKISQDEGTVGAMNANLLRKMQILEIEKEELRKKLLSLTRESNIPKLIACESADSNDSAMTVDMQEGYIEMINKLRAENHELQEKLSACTDC